MPKATASRRKSQQATKARGGQWRPRLQEPDRQASRRRRNGPTRHALAFAVRPLRFGGKKPWRLPKDFKCANGPCSDGEATASRDGAADRPRADDDALPPGREGGAPTPRRPRATLRRTGAADWDALQRSSAGAVQAVLLQEVSRVPPPLRQRPRPCGAGPGRRDVHHLRRRPAISLSPGTNRPSSVPPLVRRRHVDLAGLPGEVLPDLENEDAQAEEGDGRHEEEEEDRRRIISGQGRVHGEIRSEEPPREVEPVRQGDRAADGLAPTR